MKYGWSRSRGFSLRDVENKWSYHLTLWRQPWHRWLMFKIYHWYDMRMYKVPGFKTVERWLLYWEERRLPEDMISIPWGAKQDCRCYFLSEKQRKVLLNLEVTKEQYDGLKGHDE
jgi:hypothetical protein